MKIRRKPRNSIIRQTESSELIEKSAVIGIKTKMKMIDLIKSFTEIKKKQEEKVKSFDKIPLIFFKTWDVCFVF
jgi:hypothetical protein